MQLGDLINSVEMSFIEVKGQFNENGNSEQFRNAVRSLLEDVELLAEKMEGGE